MKKIIIVFSILLLIGCKSKKFVTAVENTKIEKLGLSDVNEIQKNKAYELGKEC